MGPPGRVSVRPTGPAVKSVVTTGHAERIARGLLPRRSCPAAAAWITNAIDHFGQFCPRLKPRSWIFTAAVLASPRSASVAAAIR